MEKAVEFIKINKRFPGAHVLKDISFSVEEGEVHALLGENGAGKSTLLNILHGVYTEYEGTVKLHGREVRFKNVNDAIVNGCAASLVKDGEVIYIDAGSTALKMIPYLKDKNITIVTTNVLIFQEMAGAKAECIIVGGDVLIDTGSVVGDLTVSMLENMYFSRAFLGITGVSVKAGFSTPNLKESRKKQIAKAHSKHAYILADSSKVGIITMCKASVSTSMCVMIDYPRFTVHGTKGSFTLPPVIHNSGKKKAVSRHVIDRSPAPEERWGTLVYKNEAGVKIEEKVPVGCAHYERIYDSLVSAIEHGEEKCVKDEEVIRVLEILEEATAVAKSHGGQ